MNHKKTKPKKFTRTDFLLYFLGQPIVFNVKRMIEDTTGITRGIRHGLFYKN